MIENVIKKWWEWIGIHLFPHKLRHTFATNLLRNNAKLPHIQKLLWHSSLDTTQIYLTVLDDELKETQKLLQRF
jgi:site-specific recombinase XerD